MRRLIMFFGLILLALSLSAVPGGAQTSLVFVFTSLPDYPTAISGSNFSGISGGGTGTITPPVSGDKDKEGHAYGNCKETEENHEALQAKENETEGKGEDKNCVSASAPEVHVGYYSDASGNHGFSHTGTAWTSINVPAGVPGAVFPTQALGINSTGQIVGFFFNTTGGHGFLDTGGTFTTVDVSGAPLTEATGINGSGQIVGWFIGSNWRFHGFTLVGSTLSTIDYPGAKLTQAFGINNTGQIVGMYYDSVWQAHGFLLSGGSFSTFDYPLASHTEATGINSSGQIVGWYYDSIGLAHGFLLSGGSFSTVDYPGGMPVPRAPMGISDLGKIVGVYQDAMGKIHGFEAAH